ncbi:CLUMA_CG011968, isoform A [Clunio marinus]|uniref:CLUMA_CG011968, isoform A n=1 Tax=Clunio marinus TaxID=568069 RepID=A0A1J1IJ70_9DIPT|nr:CLUMA_CG011968, isoform A [Clunio marinus]
MTMADHHNTNGPSMPCQMSPSNEMEQSDASCNRSDPKKRKRKRLLAVLDKLHHNNTNSNNNNNNILVNNNIIATTTNDDDNVDDDDNQGDDKTININNNMHLARSMQENAEILRNLFALSRSLPTTHPAFPSPFAALSSPSYEHNNNNKNINNNINFIAPSPDKMLLNGRVKMEVKEEVMDEEETTATVQDTKTPLHEFLHHQLPKTTFNNQSLSLRHHHQQQQQSSLFYQHTNGFFPNQIQDAPLDLSMKTFKRRQSSSSTSSSPCLTKQLLMQQTEQKLNAVLHPLGIQVPKDCSISIQTTPNSASSSPHQLPQYYQDLKVSPIVEEIAPGSNNVAYVCPICGQMFSLNDRLAKHIASRHKTKSPASETTKSYVCEVCDRSFARSDMLTRHVRLHTGVKPYTCLTCGQVFSRSDHLSTHQRTHTGEKPYRCPQCNYAACRRDMITRHMRTHARYEQNGQPPRKGTKIKTEKIKMENKVDEPTKLTVNNINNNNDLSMFNQNSLENLNELRMKIQENLLAGNGALMPNDISNLKREIKIEF